VLAGLGRELCMLRVKLVWRGDVNRLDRVVAAKLVDALISWRREFGAEGARASGRGSAAPASRTRGWLRSAGSMN